MNQYMLLLHERPMDAAQVSPAEMMEVVARYKAWAGDLAQRGLLLGGEKLADEGGRHLRLQAGQPLARTCPHLEGTQWIEIRRIELM